MGSRNRQRQSSSSSWNSSKGNNSSDNIGNRKSFKEIRIPADDIGNRNEAKRRAELMRDDIGNSIEVAPTHSLNSAMVGNDGKPRRSREPSINPQRVGRYLVGGVNPVVAGGNQPALVEETFAEDDSFSDSGRGFSSNDSNRPARNKKRRKKRRPESQVTNNVSVSDSAERRLKRLFDFDEDDRFEYILTSDPEQKRAVAEETVVTIFAKSGREVIVNAKLLKNDTRQSVLVVIEEQSSQSTKPLFVRGSVELTALNFLVNKIVNRYPNDRIRLVVLPKIDEEEYSKNFLAADVSAVSDAEGLVSADKEVA
ncbi:MAG: hypothetical protein O2793_17670 [Proteobacteria bacterium]|nr:hypothetical protein [Pseudomonadota bacterium]